MTTHGPHAHTGIGDTTTAPHLDDRGVCNCDCDRCADTETDIVCTCPDCIGGRACGIHGKRSR